MLELAHAAMVGIVSVRLFMMVPPQVLLGAKDGDPVQWLATLYCEVDLGLPSVH
jgi:hypothetical protein